GTTVRRTTVRSMAEQKARPRAASVSGACRPWLSAPIDPTEPTSPARWSLDSSGFDGREAGAILELLEEMVRQGAEMVLPARFEPHVVLTPVRRPVLFLVEPPLGLGQILEFVVERGALGAVEEGHQRHGMSMLQRARKPDIIIQRPIDDV